MRRAKAVLGETRFVMTCAPRFDYGRASHRVEQKDGEVLFISEGQDGTALRLRTKVPVRIENGDAIAEFTLRDGETAAFILEEAVSGQESPSGGKAYEVETFKETLNFWQRWMGRSKYRGRWREMVGRSAMTLKLLTSAPHGSIVAAATFGLPEEIGGVRNWDYRYTWIRDASFTLYAFMRLGYTDEAAAVHELDRGSMRRTETRMATAGDVWNGRAARLCRKRNSPIWKDTGNPARCASAMPPHDQLQLDIYGELMDSVYIYNKYGEPISYDFWVNLVRLIDWVCEQLAKPDEGIWEVRGGAHEFLYSRVMCWVAIDRGIRLAHKRSFPAPLRTMVRSAGRDLPRHLSQLLGIRNSRASFSTKAPRRWMPPCC